MVNHLSYTNTTKDNFSWLSFCTFALKFKNMKIFLITMVLALGIQAQAQKPIFTQAKIESARVYNNGAELTHKSHHKRGELP